MDDGCSNGLWGVSGVELDMEQREFEETVAAFLVLHEGCGKLEGIMAVFDCALSGSFEEDA